MHLTSTSTESPAARLRDVFLVFLKLGLTAFGGPAAHIGLFHDEVVRRRRWLNDQEFLDLLGATNLIPGPNSTEMAIHVGRLRAGWPGLIAGGVGFILPAMLLVMALAAAYVHFGATPQVNWLLLGIKPVIIAIIAQALLTLGQKALRSRLTMAAAGLALALALLGVNELTLLFGITLAVMLLRNWRWWPRAAAVLALPWGVSWTVAAGAAPFTLARLFFTFLKIGSVLYGSGYVLFAFVRADFVLRLGWLSDRQLIDAIAVGQVTPGPLFTTATFIGYLLGGVGGAVLATVGIFLPAFIFVALSGPLIPRLRASPWASALLDGANAASLGLMAAVTWQLARAAFSDWFTVGLGLLSGLLLVRFRMPSTWLLLGGAAAGLAMMLAT